MEICAIKTQNSWSCITWDRYSTCRKTKIHIESWFNFLMESRNHLTQGKDNYELCEQDSEAKHSLKINLTSSTTSSNIGRLERISSWSKMKRVVEIMFKFTDMFLDIIKSKRSNTPGWIVNKQYSNWKLHSNTQRSFSSGEDIRIIQIDSGTNFFVATTKLKRAFSKMDKKNISDLLMDMGEKWLIGRLNPPTAGSMGGVWERQIKSARSILVALIKSMVKDSMMNCCEYYQLKLKEWFVQDLLLLIILVMWTVLLHSIQHNY